MKQTIDSGKLIALVPDISLEMVYIPEGTFMMGSPDTERATFKGARPQHQVTVAEFWMGKYPITQAQYQAIMGNNPAKFKGNDRPVERVNWFNALEFCNRLSAHTGQIYTLPSEAQWEYACRASTITPFYFGETISPELANYSEGLSRDSKGTTDVGSFPPNAFGLYDMHGNVWEWCLDHFHDSYEGAPTDGSAWVTGGYTNFRILRGGSWIYLPWYCRSASRNIEWADDCSYFIGFRVVSVPPSNLG